MYVQLLFVLGLAYAVTARDCLLPTDMGSFDMKKYEGIWYELAFTTGNKSEENEYDGHSCVQLTLKDSGDYFDARVDFVAHGEKKEETGKYELIANKNSFFSIFFPEEPEYKDYLYKIMCTDYTTYAVYYSGAQYDAGHCSEYTVLLGRDRSSYGELIANEDVKKCLQDKLQTPANSLQPISQSDCQ